MTMRSSKEGDCLREKSVGDHLVAPGIEVTVIDKEVSTLAGMHLTVKDRARIDRCGPFPVDGLDECFFKER